MVLGRRKCRILLTWIFLVLFAQLLLYAMLFSEFESVPKKRLSERLELQNLYRSPVEGKPRNLEIISKSNSNLEFQIRDDLTSRTGNRKKIVSRKLEKLEVDAELFPSSVPNVRTSEVKPQDDRKILVSKVPQTENAGNEVMFVQKSTQRPTEPEDVFISVKTTGKYHSTRVEEIRNTWWTTAKQQTYFFTDTDNPALNQSLGGYLVNTQCKDGHQSFPTSLANVHELEIIAQSMMGKAALCCKMAYELNYFWEKTKKRWFCHFDDDNYVHFPALIKLLQQHDHSKPTYLGKTSLGRKMTAWDRKDGNKQVSFWFATGGAGVCLSRKLISLMVPYFSGLEAFPDTCTRIGLPDDCVIGFISEYLLNVKLEEIHLFHSHLEWLADIPQHKFHDQISFSHGYLGGNKNHIHIDGPFSIDKDPSRFKSLHCYLFPKTSWCPNNQKNTKKNG